MSSPELRQHRQTRLTFLENGALPAGHIQVEGGIFCCPREAQRACLVRSSEHHHSSDLVPTSSSHDCFHCACDHCKREKR